MFEHRHQPLLSRQDFIKRMFKSVGLAFSLLVLILLIGTAGFHNIEQFSLIDAFLNSVLIMTGLGLVNSVNTPYGKLFTSGYALLSALFFYAILAILITPLFHRLLHRFHFDVDDKRLKERN
ncbi:MAG: hypothetical protein HQL24_04355 [Candidatus Omnitrophica bacterium]|nr:hypothetical protein [Candidatus Omnitrophota bacterium]